MKSLGAALIPSKRAAIVVQQVDLYQASSPCRNASADATSAPGLKEIGQLPGTTRLSR